MHFNWVDNETDNLSLLLFVRHYFGVNIYTYIRYVQSLAKPVSGGAQKMRARRRLAASQAQASVHGHFLLHLPFISGRSSPDLIHKTPPTSKSYFFLPHLTSWPSLTRPCTVTILTNTHHFYILVPLYGPFVTFFLRVKPNPIHSRILYVNVPNPINQLLFVLFIQSYMYMRHHNNHGSLA